MTVKSCPEKQQGSMLACVPGSLADSALLFEVALMLPLQGTNGIYAQWSHPVGGSLTKFFLCLTYRSEHGTFWWGPLC